MPVLDGRGRARATGASIRSDYGRINPLPSDFAWLADTDLGRAQSLWDAARNFPCAWLRVLPLLVDKQRVQGEFADLANRNINGEITHVRDWLRPVCPNQPDVREYAANAFTEVMGEVPGRLGRARRSSRWTRRSARSPARGGGCFCAACKKAAPAFGFDLEKIQAALLKDPDSNPNLGQWQQFRFASVAAFYQTPNWWCTKGEAGHCAALQHAREEPRATSAWISCS